MLQGLRQRPLIRALFTVAVAVMVIVRGGPLTTVCDAVTSRHAAHSSGASAAHDMGDMKDMASHSTHGDKGCDTQQKPRDCGLMLACAPALSASIVTREMPLPDTLAITASHLDAPAPVDRSPDPPPPRV